MRLIALIFAAALLLPAPTWGQSTPPPNQYEAAKRSIDQAIANSIKANFERRQIEEWAQVSTYDKIKAYMALDATKGDNWLRVAQALGLPVGTKLSYPIPYDSAYCKANPTASICTAMGEGEGGGGAGTSGTWGQPDCDQNYTLDLGGNLIVRSMNLPDPVGYKFGQQLWQATTDTYLHVNEPWAALKVKLHMLNVPQAEHLRYAPMYATQYCASAACSYSLFTSRPAYVNSGGTISQANFLSQSVGINPNSIAWNQGTGYGPPPPPGYECPDGIGMGQWNQHYKACIKPPTAWAIPSYGVLQPSQVKPWAQGSNMSFCKVSDEFIRFLADRLYEETCKKSACDAPYSRVEKEDVRTGGQPPTIRDLGNTPSTLPDSSPDAGTPDPQPTPTSTPTQGPDWSDPGTGAPNPQAPDLNIEWDWIPAINLNLGSPQCPTYSADFFGHTVVLDQHCPFIEQNRAIISAMMILMFTIAAGIIVLRA